MNKLLCTACAALLSLAVAFPCFAATSPWAGTWKEDVSKDKLTGSTVTITAKGSGYHFSNGPISYDFACDGKPYPTFANNTIACTASSDGGFDLVTTANGATVAKSHRSFSADGKRMTMKVTSTAADGTVMTSETVRKRMSGTTGLVGEWVDEKIDDNNPEVETITVNGDMLHMESLHEKSSIDVKLDGTEAKPAGPRVPAGATASYKAVGANKLLFASKLNGKSFVEGTMTLSPDGKTCTFVTWLAGKPSEKTTEVLIKQ